MIELSENDLSYIQNKYHKTNEPFNAYNRMGYHGYEYDPETGLDDEHMEKSLKLLSEKLSGLPHAVAKAKAVEFVLNNARIDVSEHDWYIGFYNWGRLIDSSFINPWVNKTLMDTGENNTKKELYEDTGTVSIWPDFDHVIPNWEDLLEFGYTGLLNRVKKYHSEFKLRGITEKQEAFFSGIEITYEAIINLINRYYCLALTKSSKKSKLQVECLLHLRDGVPTNTYEALQSMYIFFMVCECVDHYQTRSIGNGIDQTLIRFYRQDINSGKFTEAQVKTFMAYFFLQFTAIGNYWGHPMYMGGTNADGSTKVNEVSYAVLDIYEELKIYNPKIQIKVNKNTPKEFLYRIFKLMRQGISSFVFCCEPGMTKAIMSYGATLDEARNFEISGCYEMRVRSDESVTTGGYINMLKGIELLMNGGFDSKTGKKVLNISSDIENIESFEDFYTAYLCVMKEIIENTIKIVNSYEKSLDEMNPANVYNATIERCLKRAVDGYSRGVKFNNTSNLCCGFASAVDSLMAVKELVFDSKKVTLSELKKALDANWQGYEKLHAMALCCKHKYGNHDEQTDALASGLARWYADHVNGVSNSRGGVYKSIMHTAMMFIWQAEKTAATPDGRKSGEEMSKNASPSVGMDKNGATALIESAYGLNPTLFPESFCVDVMLHPSATEGEEGLNAMYGLLMTYLLNDGMSIQFNIFNVEMLKDAQKHPQNYQNLQVRVCGWNVLWNNLNSHEQESYICRAQNVQ